MAQDRVLTQDEIDSVFKAHAGANRPEDIQASAEVYDFRRPDRIPKDQLRSIYVLHENFARTLSSSLSAYLRDYVGVNLVSVEQLSFVEFVQCLSSPSCMVSLSMKPYDGNSLLELSPSLAFPILEMLLGGRGRQPLKIGREITEIEQNILESVFRIILNDLRSAWSSVTLIDFAIDQHETEPQLLQILAPTEAVVAISLEARIGNHSGMMNLAVPSITVKMLRQKFDQQWSMRRTQITESEQERIFRLVQNAILHLDLRLNGDSLTFEEMMDLAPGQVLMFDHPVARSLDLHINGRLKYKAKARLTGLKRSVELLEPHVQEEFQRVRELSVPVRPVR